MKSIIIAILVLILHQGAGAQTDNSSDVVAIKKLAEQWQEAWNKKDATGMTALLADDVDFVTVLGPKGWMKGRAQFQEAHARMFQTLFTESVWTNKETHVKFLRPDLAIQRVLWQTTGDKVRHRKHGELREGIFTWVVEKKNDQWLIVASQNTESMPILPGQ
jgi:uncharacterized protein (TIGR02246 family)